MFGYKAKIVETLAAANITPNSEYTAERLERLEYDMRDNLEDIVLRAQELIKHIDLGRADYTAQRIMDSAGASGPIPSLYEKLMVMATQMDLLLKVATTKEVK
ncbi:hypothetical protein UFOVP1219_29 [uncultured Caudovirales phage]|uniref:Uncharacterized protein n=1 Tax=uncultured Caudovirales phage TaxID=2100421 RepID=A0A6J5Q5U5_9CAUD|nr:hypothetical protein UFOVP476_1 [uncultured Caudovirales phage]CAB4176861.1 hypothetical protein UFOVP986_74 [uncultured Caudovirales phage]CAB4191185.1 hypothetical protein UFOVP1219_29 [uncultured Caudovirales phage]CAB4223096.1 hypothetical protein UFOVP1671_4 [uncultured Caudovirales phage]CAB5220509.1 hypothetical protein UFOVP358_29 [uncultured Caudovirales phage]